MADAAAGGGGAAAAPVRSFAQAAASEEKEQPLRSVQIDGLAVMKMRKHCQEWAPQLVTGLLLGLDIGSTLEVTHCFPFPNRGVEAEDEAAGEADGAMYQLEMMRCLREVNVDNNTVGWYQSTTMGSYHSLDLIDTFLNYQENIKRCVCIVHDPGRSAARGGLALKALKLKPTFMELFRASQFNGEKLRDKNVTWADIFEEIPIRMSNSVLVSAVMSDFAPQPQQHPTTQEDIDRLVLSTNPFMEHSLELLSECMDDLSTEQQRFQYWNRSVQRQQQQQATWLQKRRSENAIRRAAGEEPLPEDEDPTNPIFKPIPEPSRVESYLIDNQVANYATQLNEFAGPALTKLFLMGALNGNVAL